jgi:hydroxymethylbilane synthase
VRAGSPVERFDDAQRRQGLALRVGRKSALARSLDCQIVPTIWLHSLTPMALFRLHHGLVGTGSEPLPFASKARFALAPPAMTRPFTIGTRGSPLALAQARLAAAALEEAHGWVPGSVAILPVKTSGDRIQDRPLAEVGGKALWTKELDLALLAGETDCSVHSMKDVESERPETLTIAAMLPRADVRDRLIGAGSISALPQGAVVGTSSPRRAAQLKRLRPDLVTVSIRGNVDTRLAKLAAGEVDATLLAAAGLERLGRSDVGSPVDPDEMLPAPAQGAIGIECRSDDAMAAAFIAAIDHRETHDAVLAERAFTLALGGTCHSPVAALARIEGDEILFAGEIFSADGSQQVGGEARFPIGDLDAPAALARRMIGDAPASIRVLFEGQ